MIKSEQVKRNIKILEAFKRAESVRMIAAYHGLSTQQINNIINKMLPLRKKRLDK